VRLPVDEEFQTYENSLDCRFRIIPPEGTSQTRISFIERFGIEPNRQGGCYDSLKLKTANGNTLMRYCGLSLPDDYVFGNNELIMDFTSDSSGRYLGFAATMTFQ
jgi:hypothetical protein